MNNEHRSITVMHRKPGDVASHRNEKATSKQLVTHDHAVVVFHLAGHAIIRQREEHTLRAGDLLLVPAGEPHRMVEAEGLEAIGVGFCASCLAVTDLAPLLSPLARVRGGASPVLTVPVARRSALRERFDGLATALLDNDRPGDTAALVQRSWLALLLAEVKTIGSVAGHVAPRPSVVADALAYIEQHCLEPISLAHIAAAVSRTPSYVTSLLSSSTGKTAGAWITAGRMSEARRRLLHTDERIDIVAERVGYADVTHFTRLFKRAHGLPPGAWRAQHRMPT